MHPLVLFQGVLVITRLLTHLTHKVGLLGVGRHVRPQGTLPSKIFAAHRTRECPLPRVDDHVGVQMRSGRELFVTKVTDEFSVVVSIGNNNASCIANGGGGNDVVGCRFNRFAVNAL